MPMAVEVSRRRFTADEYQAMGRAGILREDDRVELIDGEVLAMSPVGPSHNGTVNRLTALFGRLAFPPCCSTRRMRPLAGCIKPTTTFGRGWEKTPR